MKPCCHAKNLTPEEKPAHHEAGEGGSCHSDSGWQSDYLLLGSLAFILPAYAAHWFITAETGHIAEISASVFELINRMWWGLALGIVFVGLLEKIPQSAVMAALGRGGGLKGIMRATFAGMLLDLCSHGILLVGAKLYRKGISAGQLMAFLIASPWNSFSLTLIMWSLMGLKWTLAFISLSMAVAVLSGLIFEMLTKKGIIPKNPNTSTEKQKSFKALKKEWKQGWKNTKLNGTFFFSLIKDGLKDGRMVLRWIAFGVVLATLIRVFVPMDYYTSWFGASLLGLLATLVMATVIEVCSEGSTPVAADLLTRAHAPGNAFTFLMAGVSTDYTEIMVLRETTSSWKFSVFLPLVTLPQILLLGWLLNQFAVN